MKNENNDMLKRILITIILLFSSFGCEPKEDDNNTSDGNPTNEDNKDNEDDKDNEDKKDNGDKKDANKGLELVPEKVYSWEDPTSLHKLPGGIQSFPLTDEYTIYYHASRPGGSKLDFFSFTYNLKKKGKSLIVDKNVSKKTSKLDYKDYEIKATSSNKACCTIEGYQIIDHKLHIIIEKKTFGSEANTKITVAVKDKKENKTISKTHTIKLIPGPDGKYKTT